MNENDRLCLRPDGLLRSVSTRSVPEEMAWIGDGIGIVLWIENVG
jgi:hypothetical protein